MSWFHLRRGDELLGPMTAEELRARRVAPDELVRHGDAGPWAHLSTVIAAGGDGRQALEDGVEPDEPWSEPWRRRSLVEVTWPIMLLAADAIWFLRAAPTSTAAVVVMTAAVAAVALALGRPWAWPMAALTCAATSTWLLAPLIAAPSVSFAIWLGVNAACAAFLLARRPRGPALDWPRDWRRLLLLYSSDPEAEASPLRERAGRAGPGSAFLGAAAFFGIVLSAVAIYHAVRFPGRDIPLGLVPRGNDLAAVGIAVGVYGLMVVLAVLLSLRGRAVVASLGLGPGQGLNRALWTGFRVFLMLFVVLLASRWTLRAVDVVERRVHAASDSSDQARARARTATGQVRSAVERVLDRAHGRRSLTPQSLLLLLLGLLLAPLCEELFFRGLVFGALRRSYPFWVSALISSALFAGGHGWGLGWGLAGPVLWLQIFAGGFAAAFAYERTGGLAAPVVMHLLWNAAQAASQFSVTS
jgi:membrane protease YdiL (CAAX protease family)